MTDWHYNGEYPESVEEVDSVVTDNPTAGERRHKRWERLEDWCYENYRDHNAPAFRSRMRDFVEDEIREATRAARAEERERCCKAVCPICSEGEAPTLHCVRKPVWWHMMEGCQASDIHALPDEEDATPSKKRADYPTFLRDEDHGGYDEEE